MKKFLKRSLEFVTIVLVFNSFMEINAQCPTIPDLLNRGYSDKKLDWIDHKPENTNWDEIGVFRNTPFMVKVDDYPPIASFPIIPISGCTQGNAVWYMSFDGGPDIGETDEGEPIRYIVWNPILPNGNDWIEKKHNLWTFDENGDGYHVQVFPTSTNSGADSFSGIWSEFVSEPEPYSTTFNVVIEGPDVIEEGLSAEYIANIFGGNGDYGIYWEYKIPPSQDWIEIKSNYYAADYFEIEYPEGTSKNYYFYQTVHESEYKHTITMGSQNIELRVTIEDHAGGSFYTSATKIIKKGVEISFANKIESAESYGQLILDCNASDGKGIS